MSKRRAQACLFFTSVVLSSLSYAAQPDRIQGTLFGGQRVALSGSVHHKALPQYDRGAADPATQFGTITLLTTPTAAQQKALTQLLADQQNRQSPNYHKWLTPEQWADRFGLSQNDIGQITTWLRSQGFTIVNVARGRNWITFRGSAMQVESAFGTAIHRFYVKNEWHVANATDAQIPAALAGIVSGVRGLNDFRVRPRAKVRPHYYDSNIGIQVAAPGDIATIYDINPLYTASTPVDGTGQKLAVIGQTDIYLSDIADFRANFGLSSITCTTNSSGVITSCNDPHLKYVVADGITDPGVPLTGGDLSEADLDLEWAGAVARGAQLIYVNAPTNGTGGTGGGVWNAWYWAVDQNLASVITLSYGVCEFGDNNVMNPLTGQPAADELELQKANSLGITFVNSSGDSGAAECDPTAGGTDPHGSSATQGLALSYPASSPEVTGVGGTATPLNDFGTTFWGTINGSGGGSAQGYVPEQAWNDDEELAQYCTTSASNQFCSQGGRTAVRGWQPITATTANPSKVMQEDLALLGSGISSTGGGASNCATQNSAFTACVSGFPRPAWQTVTISGQASARFSPDVSFLASPNFPGYIFCTELSELGATGTGSSCASGIPTAIEKYTSIIGGTSASAPLFAGMVTLLNQYLSASGLGNVNPTLYQLAGNPANGAFNVVNTGDNLVYCTVGTPGSPQPAALDCPSAGVFGFDASTSDPTNNFNLATGLGSVDVNNLATAWAASGNAGAFTLSPSPASVTASAGTSSSSTTITITPKNGFSGTVSFSCSAGLPSGATCNFAPPVNSTSSTLVISTAANTAAASNIAITVKGTSGAASATTTVNLTVTATSESFSLGSSISGGTLAVAQGSNTSAVNMTVTSNSNPSFVVTSGASSQTALPLTYSCTGLPSASTCNFSPGGPTSVTSVSMTITTTAPTARLQPPLDRGTRIFYATLLPGLFGVMLTFGSRRRSLLAMRVIGLMAVLGCSTLWLASCGSSGSSGTVGNPGTPVGTYPIKVTASTGGAAPITSSVSFQLTVNP